MLRKTLLGIAGCALAAHFAGGVCAQATFVAYDGPVGPIGPDFNAPQVLAGHGVEVADDLHLDLSPLGAAAPKLASFDFWARVIGPEPTADAEVRFYEGDVSGSCPPLGQELACIEVNLEANVGNKRKTVDLSTPLALPPSGHLWMSLTLTTPGFGGGLGGYGVSAGSSGSASVGESYDIYYDASLLPPCNLSSTFNNGNAFNFSVTLRLLKEDAVPVQVDIKPGSFPNSINLGSMGVTPVAILSTLSFDATTVDPSSVTIRDADVRVKGKGTNYQTSFQDVNGDGLVDIVVKVDTQGFSLTSGDVVALLEGEASDGVTTFPFYGTDSVRVVP